LENIELGNIDAKRDWGYAKVYVEGMWLMLQEETPDTYILATNRTQSIRDFLCLAFSCVGIDIEFSGKNENEVAYDVRTGKVVMKINPKYYRPSEVELLVGDYSKASKILGWKPMTSLEELCKKMVMADLSRNKNGFIF